MLDELHFTTSTIVPHVSDVAHILYISTNVTQLR